MGNLSSFQVIDGDVHHRKSLVQFLTITSVASLTWVFSLKVNELVSVMFDKILPGKDWILLSVMIQIVLLMCCLIIISLLFPTPI